MQRLDETNAGWPRFPSDDESWDELAESSLLHDDVVPAEVLQNPV